MFPKFPISKVVVMATTGVYMYIYTRFMMYYMRRGCIASQGRIKLPFVVLDITSEIVRPKSFIVE